MNQFLINFRDARGAELDLVQVAGDGRRGGELDEDLEEIEGVVVAGT